jgi:hypothetical protein
MRSMNGSEGPTLPNPQFAGRTGHDLRRNCGGVVLSLSVFV